MDPGQKTISRPGTIYARPPETKTDNQLIELRQVAERMGWVIVEEYQDLSSVVANDRKTTPSL